MDAQRASRAASARKRAEEADKREEALRASFAKKAPPLANILDVYERTLEKRAPKLLENPSYREVVRSMRSEEHVRSIRDWEPRGKGCGTLFRSLCDHIWAKYPMPAFLWSGFFERNTDIHGLVKDVARGGSLFTYSKEGRFQVPLTRAMVHELMAKTPGDFSFTRAIRRIQVKTAGGTPRFFQVWADSRPGQALGTRDEEIFWASVIDWFSKHPMFDPTQVGPMVDYISYRRNQDRTFSMKGRSPMAMLRGMQEWHNELAKVRQVKGTPFLPSGFKEFEWTRSSKGVQTIWRIKEILTSKELLTEGRVMRHCVGSYSYRIESKTMSIWSLSAEQGWTPEEKVCTIEVSNVNRSIVQARGKFNKMIETEPFQVMQRWASENALSINLGRW